MRVKQLLVGALVLAGALGLGGRDQRARAGDVAPIQSWLASAGSIAWTSTAFAGSCRIYCTVNPNGSVAWSDLNPFDVAEVESAASGMGAEGGVLRALARLTRLEAGK
jgi:hypothetical protein